MALSIDPIVSAIVIAMPANVISIKVILIQLTLSVLFLNQ
ncbi:hypothetical protein IQ31_01095 [Sphingobacterium siyangense]|uniref:Uncharacterized protein n=1 Tax=Sphingobacterium siyangense TaxID=459529 RepID=A0A562MSI6_9SPHI|nr:hypothetical protein IQ31_01095 [Sphingobacterium siyangense]